MNGEIYIYVPNALNPSTNRENWYDWFGETHFWSYSYFHLLKICSCFDGIEYKIDKNSGVIELIITKKSRINFNPGGIAGMNSFLVFLKIIKTFVVFPVNHYYRGTTIFKKYIEFKKYVKKIIGWDKHEKN